MKRIIPILIPFFTIKVWCPWKVASRVISRHHWYIDKIRRVVLRIVNHVLNKLCIIMIVFTIIRKMFQDIIIGQGLFSTKWNGWNDII